MSGNTGKVKLAEGLGLLTDWQIQFIEALARIRNRYAHNVKNMHRSLMEMLTEEQQNNHRIVAQLTGLPANLPADFDSPIGNLSLKFLMYYRLTDFLANALHTLRPPPPEPGGLLVGLMERHSGDVSNRPDIADGEA
jgi:hypothetical protein